MGTKTGILIGVGIGYVLGARAGRERYEQIRAGASKVRRFPIVARPLVADAVKERLFGAPAQSATVDGEHSTASTQR